MQLTIFSFGMACVLTSVFILLTCFMRRCMVALQYYGVMQLVLIYVICIVRMLVPIETPFTRILTVSQIYNPIYHILQYNIPLFSEGSHVTVQNTMMTFWITVTVILLFKLSKSYWISNRYACSYKKCSTQSVLQMMEKVKKVYGKPLHVEICYGRESDIPVGMGIWKPRIVIPDRTYSDGELYDILLHEYTHIRNKDLYVKLLTNIWKCIFWWNPFAYLLSYHLEQTLELKCDLTLAGTLTESEKIEYMETIVKELRRCETKEKTQQNTAVGLYQFQKKSFLKERFLCIVKAKENKRTNRVKLTGILILCTTVFLLSYSVVLQPKFDIPADEDKGVVDLEAKEVYLIKKGKKYDVMMNGKYFSTIDESMLYLFEDNTYQIIEK